MTRSIRLDQRNLNKFLFEILDVTEAPSEEILRDQEANILQLGEKLREEGKTKEMTDLIQKVRNFLRFMSKAKAAKLVRGLVDMFLEMERSEARGEREVQLCKVSYLFLEIHFLTKLNKHSISKRINNFFNHRNVLNGPKKSAEHFYVNPWNQDWSVFILKQNVTRKL